MTAAVFEKISIFGLGYIGLPTATMFASYGIKTVGVDVNPNIVDKINQGEIHIIEPDLDLAVQKAVALGDLRATLVPEPADVFLVTVPTPFIGDAHEADLSYVRAAAKMISKVLAPGNLVVLESTSPIGATHKMAQWMAKWRPDLSFPQTAGENSDIRIAYCPERVLPGKVMQELITNDRIVGGMTAACSKLAIQLYKTFVSGDCVVASSPNVAEMAKLTENSFRDVNIAFANELSIVSHELNIDVWELIALSNRHPRVNILQPGPGVGGHCIAVDPWFIVSSAPKHAALIRQARLTNDAKPKWVVDLVKEHMKRRPDAEVIVYGITFKPDIDDLRESPSLDIFRRLKSDAADRVAFCDPNVSPGVLDEVSIEIEDAFGRDAIHVLLVDHAEFMESRPQVGTLVDFKGIWGGSL